MSVLILHTVTRCLLRSGASPGAAGTELRDLPGRCNCGFRTLKGVRPKIHRVPDNTEERDQPSSPREGHGDCGEEAEVCKADKKSNREWRCGWAEARRPTTPLPPRATMLRGQCLRSMKSDRRQPWAEGMRWVGVKS